MYIYIHIYTLYIYISCVALPRCFTMECNGNSSPLPHQLPALFKKEGYHLNIVLSHPSECHTARRCTVGDKESDSTVSNINGLNDCQHERQN